MVKGMIEINIQSVDNFTFSNISSMVTELNDLIDQTKSSYYIN